MKNRIEKIQKANDNKIDSKKSKWKKILKKIAIGILIAILTVIILGGMVAGIFYFKNRDKISGYIQSGYERVSKIDENTFNSRHTTKVLDKDGNVIKEFKTANYKYAKYDEINKQVFDAVIAIEDERFYEHKGIDYIGLMRAFSKIILSGGKTIQGGSTITQQLVKNVFLSQEQTIWRKLEEMVIAQEIEKKYSKEEIIEFYVNNNYFGYGCHGIETASDYFFQKPTTELTTAQIALLVGIPNNPTIYDPILNPDNALKKRNIILGKMYELGYISEEEYNTSKAEKVELNVKKVSFDNTIKEYDLDFAVQKATENFMKYKGFQFRYSFNTEEERTKYFEQYDKVYSSCRQELISGGYIIETSIDREKQNKLQAILDESLKSEKAINSENGLYMRQASATVIDNITGEVVAIVGGRSQEGNTYNRASLGARQPGSVIKPLVVYTPAFEGSKYHPGFVMEDKPIKNGPKNYYSGYKGNVTLRYAVEDSINTIAYRVLEDVGVENAIQYLYNMQFKYLTPEDKTVSLGLGGFTRGATTTEIAGGYSTLARGGQFIEPTNVRKITTVGTNDIIYENTHTKIKVYDQGASYVMTDVLKGVLGEKGTAKGYKPKNVSNITAKTGTTDDRKDLWMSGYSNYYSMAVWTGNDTPSYLRTNINASKEIWKNMMTYLHQGLEEKEFEKPSNVYEYEDDIRAKVTSENEILNKRKEKEEARKEAELKEQKDRLLEEEYKIKYGLSEEEEKAREVNAESMIEQLSKFKFNSLDKEESLRALLKEVRDSIENVKRKSAYDNYLNQYNSYVSKFDKEKFKLQEEERNKLKEENEQEEKNDLNVNNNNTDKNENQNIDTDESMKVVE